VTGGTGGGDPTGDLAMRGVRVTDLRRDIDGWWLRDRVRFCALDVNMANGLWEFTVFDGEEIVQQGVNSRPIVMELVTDVDKLDRIAGEA